MITIQGKQNTAICYCDVLDDRAAAQIQEVCDTAAFAENKIRIMPDVHAGMGCTIGTTMTLQDQVVPGMVGVDIGCGMETIKLNVKKPNFGMLDHVIRKFIPCGREIREEAHPFAEEIDLSELECAKFIKEDRAYHSIGTLGGGNHFIEVDRGDDGSLYLVIHSGSRHLGKEVAEYYQETGFKALCGNAAFQIKEMIEKLKAEHREKEINDTIKAMKKWNKLQAPVSKDLAYVEGDLFRAYIHDMKIVQRFAVLNRKAMAEAVLKGMNWGSAEEFTTIHNYIDTDAMILRKGAVAANAGQKLLIPINMRDGSLICIGKGNPEWNCSAPHGAGRLMSRSAAFQKLSIEEFREQMKGIYTTCICKDTLDESPMAYKSMDAIVLQIGPTAEIVEHIHPVYNFKAAE